MLPSLIRERKYKVKCFNIYFFRTHPDEEKLPMEAYEDVKMFETYKKNKLFQNREIALKKYFTQVDDLER